MSIEVGQDHYDEAAGYNNLQKRAMNYGTHVNKIKKDGIGTVVVGALMMLAMAALVVGAMSTLVITAGF